MSGKGFVRILVIGLFVTAAASHASEISALSDEHRNSGRARRQISLLEDEMCLGNYDVSEGSIIRTHDSQKLGAKYLNETDEGQGIKAREECFLLCCKTPHCNVAVFEEKNTGSCYLFDCGPMEDFRCKFTTQPQYTSAILKKPVLQLVNQHENELTQLRTPERAKEVAESLSNNNAARPSNTPVQPVAPARQEVVPPVPLQTTVATFAQQRSPGQQLISNASIVAPSEPQALTQRRSACSRNQFECKSSKECIAIYNACDGIPQCADGSDESSELNCPPDTSNPIAVKPSVVAAPPNKPVGPVGFGRVDPYGGSGFVPSGSSSSNNNYDHSQNHYMTVQNPSHAQQEDMRLVPASVPSRGNENLMGKSQGAPPPYSMETQGQPGQTALNIFAHKDGGIMDETYTNQGQQRHASYWKPASFDYTGAEVAPASNYNQERLAYNNPVNAGGNPADNPALQQPPYQYAPYPMQQGQQQQVHPSYGGQGGVQIVPIAKQQSPYAPQPISYNRNANGQINSPSGYGSGNSAWNSNQQVVPINSAPNRLIPPTDPHSVPATPATSNALPQNPPAAPEAAVSPTTASSAGATPTGSKPESEQSLQDLSKIQLPQTMSKLSAEIRDFAAESETLLVDNKAGPGAVLAFVAGLIMSIAMAIMVGCRLRRIGTRRRGKNRLDPDFLVDGMYL